MQITRCGHAHLYDRQSQPLISIIRMQIRTSSQVVKPSEILHKIFFSRTHKYANSMKLLVNESSVVLKIMFVCSIYILRGLFLGLKG